jgi:hypothetical protein
MTKKNRFKARRAERHASMLETLRRWVGAHTRGRAAFEDLRTLFSDELTAHNLLSVDEAIDAHRARSKLSLRVAMDEVNSFHPKIIEELRRTSHPLVHPVTEFGFKNADRVAGDDAAIARSVPGCGDGGATFGWRVAHQRDDACFTAYVMHRYRSGRGAVVRSARLAVEGVNAGVLDAGDVAVPSLPVKLIEEGSKS